MPRTTTGLVTETPHASAHAMRVDNMRAGARRNEDTQLCASVRQSAREETQTSARDPITQNQTPLIRPSELPQENNAIQTRPIQTLDAKDSTNKHTHAQRHSAERTRKVQNSTIRGRTEAIFGATSVSTQRTARRRQAQAQQK